MGINLGAGFENLNGNSSISNQSAGILNLMKFLYLHPFFWLEVSSQFFQYSFLPYRL